MEQIVYFQDKTLIFTSDNPPAGFEPLPWVEDGGSVRTKVLKILESHNRVALVAPDPVAAFDRFAAEFAAVEAAGGIVADGAGRLLLIYRNDRWDLPKGHLDAGETLERCAAREVAEETGVEAVPCEPLCATRHAYWFEPTGRWELKRTHWYLLRTDRAAELRPQREEGIERVVWCTREEATRCLDAAYPTVRRVFEMLHAKHPDLF